MSNRNSLDHRSALHAALGCVLPRMRHLEYFHDHVRIEGMLLEGVAERVDGTLCVDDSVPGLGLEFKAADADSFRVSGVGGTVR